MLFRVALILSFLFMAYFAMAGVSVYNRYRYRYRGDNPRDPATVIGKGDVELLSGDYLSGFYYAAYGAARPGTVIVFKGSEGSNNDEVARQIRDHGYNVLGLYFFGQSNQQSFLANVPLEFFDEVLTWIKKHGDPRGPITVLGVSKGAELVANLAIRYSEISNIGLYSRTAYHYQGLNFQQETLPSFTWHGDPLNYIRLRFFFFTGLKLLMHAPVSYRKIYETSFSKADNRDAARIPIEKFSGQGLLCAGAQDAMWQGDCAVQSLTEWNRNLKGVVYQDAGHLFAEDINQYGPIWETMLGGTVQGNRVAKIQSDKLLFTYLSSWHAEDFSHEDR